MRSMLKAERLKKVHIHQALCKSPLVSFFSPIGLTGSPAGGAVIISDMLSLRSFCFYPGEVHVVHNRQERAYHCHAYQWNLEVDDEHPAQQEPDEHTRTGSDLQ